MKRFLSVQEKANKKGYVLINYALYAGDKAKYKLMYPQNMGIAQRFNTLKEGVIVISGGFPSRGGSTKNPRLSAYKDTVIRVEIPENLYTKIEECQGVRIVQEDTDLEADLIKIEEEIQKLESKKMEILKKLGRD